MALAPAQRRRPNGGGRRGLSDYLAGNDDSTNVSNIAADMASQENPLMQRARTEGLQTANRRGLLNSSVAVGAAQNSVLDRVIPMAQQESQQRFQGQLSRQDANQRLGENEQQFGFQSALSEQDFEQQGRLSEQQFQEASQLSEQDFEQQMGISREEYRQQLEIQDRGFTHERALQQNEIDAEVQIREMIIGSEQELARLDSDTRMQLMRMEERMRENLAGLEMSGDDRNNMASMVTSMQSQYQESLRSILSNPDIGGNERQALLAQAGRTLQNQLDMVSGLYDTDIDWGGAAIGSGGRSSGPAPTPEPTRPTSRPLPWGSQRDDGGNFNEGSRAR